MLMQLGACQFEVFPFNLTEHDREIGADYVPKDVMGAQRPREFMGLGDETRTLTARLYPEHFGGMSSLEELESMVGSGVPQILMAGDGTKQGWFFIERVMTKHRHLDPNGRGRVIEVDIAMVKSPRKPSTMQGLAMLFRLFRT